jgi:hypothetical protein
MKSSFAEFFLVSLLLTACSLNKNSQEKQNTSERFISVFEICNQYKDSAEIAIQKYGKIDHSEVCEPIYDFLEECQMMPKHIGQPVIDMAMGTGCVIEN